MQVVQLPGMQRGCHVVTRQILQQLPELQEMEVGLANLFIQVTGSLLLSLAPPGLLPGATAGIITLPSHTTPAAHQRESHN